MHLFSHMDIWLSLLALSALEIVLGVDNLVFIAIVTDKLPVRQQKLARRVGLLLAMGMRLLLLAVIVWLAESTQPLFQLGGLNFSVRDMVLLLGGLFLLVKASYELWEMRRPSSQLKTRRTAKFSWAIVQITLFDIVFSLDSVITAVGVAQHYWVMAVAIVLAVLVMILASEPVSHFILGNAKIKALALAILILVGVKLVLAAFTVDIPSSYLFIAIAVLALLTLLQAKLFHKSA